MSDHPILPDTRNVISTLELGSGPTPCETPDGPTADPSGPSANLASLSARQAKEAGLLTSGTYAPQPTISSASAALQSALASRLRAKTASVGSILYKLTWKERATPSGRSIPALRATGWSGKKAKPGNGYSGPFTIAVIPGSRNNLAILPISLAETLARADTTFASGSASSLNGYNTPQAHDTSGRSKGQKAIHGTKHGCACLVRDAELAGWVTTTTRDWKDSGSDIKPRADGTERFDQLPRQANLAGWPTPTVGNAMGSQSFEGLSATGKTPDGRKVAVALPHVATMSGWPTCTSTDATKQGQVSPRPGMMGLSETVPLSGWPTPTSSDGSGGGQATRAMNPARSNDLHDFAQLCRDNPRPIRATATGDVLTGCSAGMESGGQLDPAHSRWLQMLPPAWDACAPSATRSMRKPRPNSSKRISHPETTVFD